MLAINLNNHHLCISLIVNVSKLWWLSKMLVTHTMWLVTSQGSGYQGSVCITSSWGTSERNRARKRALGASFWGQVSTRQKTSETGTCMEMLDDFLEKLQTSGGFSVCFSTFGSSLAWSQVSRGQRGKGRNPKHSLSSSWIPQGKLR